RVAGLGSRTDIVIVALDVRAAAAVDGRVYAAGAGVAVVGGADDMVVAVEPHAGEAVAARGGGIADLGAVADVGVGAALRIPGARPAAAGVVQGARVPVVARCTVRRVDALSAAAGVVGARVLVVAVARRPSRA